MRRTLRRCTVLLAVAICTGVPTGVAAHAQTGGSSSEATGTVIWSGQQPRQTSPIAGPRRADHVTTATQTGNTATSLPTTGTDTLAKSAAGVALLLVGVATRGASRRLPATTRTARRIGGEEGGLHLAALSPAELTPGRNGAAHLP